MNNNDRRKQLNIYKGLSIIPGLFVPFVFFSVYYAGVIAIPVELIVFIGFLALVAFFFMVAIGLSLVYQHYDDAPNGHKCDTKKLFFSKTIGGFVLIILFWIGSGPHLTLCLIIGFFILGIGFLASIFTFVTSQIKCCISKIESKIMKKSEACFIMISALCFTLIGVAGPVLAGLMLIKPLAGALAPLLPLVFILFGITLLKATVFNYNEDIPVNVIMQPLVNRPVPKGKLEQFFSRFTTISNSKLQKLGKSPKKRLGYVNLKK